MNFTIAYLISQCLVIINFFVKIISGQAKTQKSYIAFSALNTILSMIKYLLLGGITGMCMLGVSFAQKIVFYTYKSKNKKTPLIIMIFLVISALIVGAITWKGIESLLPLFATVIMLFAFAQDNLTTTKLTRILHNIFYICYQIIYKSWLDLFGNGAEIISNLMWIIKDKKQEKNKGLKLC